MASSDIKVEVTVRHGNGAWMLHCLLAPFMLLWNAFLWCVNFGGRFLRRLDAIIYHMLFAKLRTEPQGEAMPVQTEDLNRRVEAITGHPDWTEFVNRGLAPAADAPPVQQAAEPARALRGYSAEETIQPAVTMVQPVPPVIRFENTRQAQHSIPPDMFTAGRTMSFVSTTYTRVDPFSSSRVIQPNGVIVPGSARFVFGQPKTALPLSGWPGDKVRLVFRNDEFAVGFVRVKNGVRKYTVEERDGCWVPGLEQARNERATVEPGKKKVRKLNI